MLNKMMADNYLSQATAGLLAAWAAEWLICVAAWISVPCVALLEVMVAYIVRWLQQAAFARGHSFRTLYERTRRLVDPNRHAPTRPTAGAIKSVCGPGWQLPADVWLVIWTSLSAQDVAHASLACKDWYRSLQQLGPSALYVTIPQLLQPTSTFQTWLTAYPNRAAQVHALALDTTNWMLHDAWCDHGSECYQSFLCPPVLQALQRASQQMPNLQSRMLVELFEGTALVQVLLGQDRGRCSSGQHVTSAQLDMSWLPVAHYVSLKVVAGREIYKLGIRGLPAGCGLDIRVYIHPEGDAACCGDEHVPNFVPFQPAARFALDIENYHQICTEANRCLSLGRRHIPMDKLFEAREHRLRAVTVFCPLLRAASNCQLLACSGVWRHVQRLTLVIGTNCSGSEPMAGTAAALVTLFSVLGSLPELWDLSIHFVVGQEADAVQAEFFQESLDALSLPVALQRLSLITDSAWLHIPIPACLKGLWRRSDQHVGSGQRVTHYMFERWNHAVWLETMSSSHREPWNFAKWIHWQGACPMHHGPYWM